MARAKLDFEPGPYRTVAFSAEVDGVLAQFAAENTGGNIAAAIRLIVHDTLAKRGGLNGLTAALERSGLRDEATRVRREMFEAIANAVNEVIEKNEG